MSCPGPAAPRLLYESNTAETYPYILFMNGREYLRLESGLDATADGDTMFLDLATGATSVLHHAPGVAYCDGVPLTCTVMTIAGGVTRLTGVALDEASGVWSAASSQDLPAGYTNILRTLPGGDLVLYGHDKPELQSFNPSTGQSQALFDLGGRSPLVGSLSLSSGPTLTGLTNSAQGAELSFAPLVPGAVWTSILKLPQPFKFWGLPIPTGDGWFVAASTNPTGTPHVWQVSSAGTVDVGSSEDPLIYEVASRYAKGDAVLEGSQGKGLVCEGGTCQSGRIDFATLARTPIGSVTLPGVTRLQVIQQRWLSCDAVDAILEEPIFSPDETNPKAVGYRLYAVRVRPDAKP